MHMYTNISHNLREYAECTSWLLFLGGQHFYVNVLIYFPKGVNKRSKTRAIKKTIVVFWSLPLLFEKKSICNNVNHTEFNEPWALQKGKKKKCKQWTWAEVKNSLLSERWLL